MQKKIKLSAAPRWLHTVKRNRVGSYAYLLATDRVRAFRHSLGLVDSNSGTTHFSLSLDESIAYVVEVFDDYKQSSGVEKFHGKVAEVGPGDNCGVALLFLANGCERVDLADRFYARRDTQHHSLIYQRLVEEHPELRNICKKYPPANESDFDGIHRYYGQEASAESFFRNHGPYDFIVSRAALEHVMSPLSALTSMTNALKTGGLLLHKVDLRDHGMFSPNFHELQFLEVPAWLYPGMTRGSGRPNRILVHQYRETLKKEKLAFSIGVTRLAGVGEILPHRPYEQIPQEMRQKSLDYIRSVRPRFASCFKSVSDEDLSVAGFFLVAKKLEAADRTS
jgi:SAM-dependent methyltransferase